MPQIKYLIKEVWTLSSQFIGLSKDQIDYPQPLLKKAHLRIPDMGKVFGSLGWVSGYCWPSTDTWWSHGMRCYSMECSWANTDRITLRRRLGKGVMQHPKGLLKLAQGLGLYSCMWQFLLKTESQDWFCDTTTAFRTAFHIRVTLWVTVVLFLIQFSVSAFGKAVADGLRACALAPHGGDMGGVSSSWLWPGLNLLGSESVDVRFHPLSVLFYFITN